MKKTTTAHLVDYIPVKYLSRFTVALGRQMMRRLPMASGGAKFCRIGDQSV